MNIKILAFSLFSIFSIGSMAQETKVKVKEIGITFYNFQKYGLQYNVGNGIKMWRFRIMNGGISLRNHSDIDPSNPNRTVQSLSSNISASIGREKRKEIAPSFKFVYGIELSGSHNYYRIQNLSGEKTRSHQLNAGIVGIIGFRYDINNKFYANAELLPSAIYSFGASNSTISNYFGGTNQALSFGFGNNSALLSFGIKF